MEMKESKESSNPNLSLQKNERVRCFTHTNTWRKKGKESGAGESEREGERKENVF